MKTTETNPIEKRIFTFQNSGGLMKGRAVLMGGKTLFSFGRSKLGKPDLFSIHWDLTGFENGTKTWVNLHILRKSFSFWILNINTLS